MPKGHVIYGDPIPVSRSNGEKAALLPYTTTIPNLDLNQSFKAEYGLVLEDDPLQKILKEEDGTFRVISTGEVLKPIDE